MDVVEIEVEVEVEVVGRGSWGVNRNLGGSTVKAMMTLSAIREVDRAQAVSGLVPRCWLLGPSPGSSLRNGRAASSRTRSVPAAHCRCCSVRIRRNDRDHLGRETRRDETRRDESVWMRRSVDAPEMVFNI
jgi:hypothetical protein